MPLDTQGGQLTNFGAAQMHQATGQYLGQPWMPRTTVGGAYGSPATHMAMAPQQLMAQASGNQYAPMGAAAGMNPGGRFWGGAMPGMFQGHQAWLGGDMAPEGYGGVGQLPNSRFVGGGTMGRARQASLAAISPGSSQYDAMQKAAAMFDARGGGLAQRQQDYWNRVTGNQQMRAMNVGQKAYAKGDSRARRMGNFSNFEAMQFGIPGFANQVLQSQNSQGWLQGQMAMSQAKLQSDQQQQHFNNLAALAGHVAGMQGLPPGLQQSYMGQLMGQFGLQGSPGHGPTGTPLQRANYLLTPQQQGQFRGLKTPQEKEAWLNANGVMDPITRQHLLGVNGPPPPAGLWGGIGQGIMDWASNRLFPQTPNSAAPKGKPNPNVGRWLALTLSPQGCTDKFFHA
jgi:hypothetical protein